IFHAHFIPMALNLGVPQFQSVHFLAPAIRVDTFRERLAGRVGQGINQLNIFTMAKDWERADNCAQIYRKSMLYLIYDALTTEARGIDGWNAPIEWPEEFADRLEERAAIAPPLRTAIQTPTFTTPMPALSNVTITGRRRALCIGINKYPTAPLAGCVADAQS